jgi:hypothetical protein
MEILDKNSLSTLMKALYVAKWESDDENAHVTELAGSPHLARIFNEIVDEFIRLDDGRPDAARQWSHWRSIEERPEELERLRARIKAMSSKWGRWTREQRLEMVDILLSPFTATATTLEELIA